MLFDTHAHYDDEAFDPDRREVLAGLPQKGVGLVVNPGCTLTSSEKVVALAAEFPHVYAAVGLHPENCHDFQPEQIERLRQLARREKVVAIGEVGLDYYWEENPPRALQQEVLRRQLALAEELKLPVKEMAADRDFLGLRIAVMRRTAFKHVDDRDVLPALQPDRLQRLREKLTALPDKRLPLEIFFRPRRFADHHDRAARSAVREHGAGPRFTETAAVAVREKRLQLIPGTVCHLAEELH